MTNGNERTIDSTGVFMSPTLRGGKQKDELDQGSVRHPPTDLIGNPDGMGGGAKSDTRTVFDPFLGKDVVIRDRLVDRLRGQYSIGPHQPNGLPEFGIRQFQAPPIQHEAAAEIERLQALVANLKLQAQCHAQEARGANATIAEAYQAVSGATGEPGNWNGAEPIRSELERLRTGFLAYIQPQNECEETGRPCRDPAKCGCWLEMQNALEATVT